MAVTLGLLPIRPQYFYEDSDGEWVPNASGTLVFTLTGLATPVNVFSDQTGSTSLGSTVTLNSAGRPSTQVFLPNTGVTCVVKNAAGVTLYTDTYVADQGAIFAMTLGNVLTEGAKGVTTSPYVVLSTDNYVTVDSATNPFVVQLPACTTRKGPTGNGLPLLIRNDAAITVRVTPAGSDLIDDGGWATTAYVSLAVRGFILIASDGVSTWRTLAFSGAT